MTAVLFDQSVSTWECTAGDWDFKTNRRYLAADPPLRLIVVIDSALAETGFEIGDLTGRVWDCNIGDHRVDAPMGYTLPRFAGLLHSKIFVRKELPDSVYEITLSEIIAGSPSGDEGVVMQEPTILYGAKGVEAYAVRMPKALWGRVIEQAPRHGLSLDTMMWQITHDWLKLNT